MKSRLSAFLLASTAFGALAGSVFAQTPPAPAAAPAVVAPLAPVAPVFDQTQFPAVKGTLKAFTMTPRGDVDGFVMTDGTQVHFPPHLSSQLVATVRPGDAVTVRGLKAAAIPMVAAFTITNDASRQMVADPGPVSSRFGGPARGPGHDGPGRDGPGRDGPRHGGPGPGAMMGATPAEVSGKVLATLHGPRGEANGAMLEDGTVLRLPPHEATRLAALLMPGQTVVAQGPGIANNLGKMLGVQAIGATKDQLSPVQGPPRGPHGPGGERRGPGRGGPDAQPPRL